jgi:Fic family protein
MHPFQDGNGRTARALEALMLQRAGLHDSTFIAMSNYYYEEKAGYLESLAAVRRQNHDLTPFLLFALKGVTLQCEQLIQQVQHCLAKALYRNVAVELLGRLQSKRKRVLAERHLDLIDKLLDAENETLDIDQLMKLGNYGKLKSAWHALLRDLVHLRFLGAIAITKGQDPDNKPLISARLKWPTEVTETEFFQKVKELPKAKSLSLFD